ncbi:hypothetical protein [Aeromicrobium sp.]|uniref:hypothetical protein n=1 Tax=Aeromicrobium sp. TaxID=1871063 RepID=UPI003C5B4E1F
MAAGAWDSVREAPIAAVTRPLDAGGLSVAVFTDVIQPERRVTCTQTTEAAKKAKREPKPIPAASLELVVNDDGNEWHLIGFEPNGHDTMSIRCTPADKRPDNATYAFSTVDGFTERANNGNGIAIIGTVLGIGLALWTFIARRRHDQETDDAPA